LKAVYNSLKIGGKLVFDSRNPDNYKCFNNFGSIDWSTIDNPQVYSSSLGKVKYWRSILEINQNKILYQNHYELLDSKDKLVSTNELIFRSLKEISQFLTKVGFKINQIYGDFEWNLANNQRSEFVFVTTK
jgi:hypothetical protein